METTTRGIPHLQRKMWDLLSILSGSKARGFEEQRKRSVLALFLMIGISITYPFAVHHFILGNLIRATLLFFVGSVQLTSLVALRFLKRGTLVFRVNVILLGVYFLFLIIIGGTHGSRILWTFIFPFLSFFLLGKREGLFWSGYSINGQAQEILNRGCEGFIQKPFNLMELSRRLREILGLR